MEASKPFYIRRVALSLLAGFFGLAWCALLLADFGCFNALLVWGIAALVVVSVFGGWRRQPEAHAERATGRWDLLAVALAVASLLLTGPPAESILGDWDPGVYVHTAAIIANQGGLLQVEPELNNLSRRELLLISRRRGTVAEPFGGMQIIDGRTSPQFYHLYPAVMAALWPLGGFRAALWLNPLLNVGSLILIYGLSTRLIGRRWGLLATVTLGVQPAQIWMARFSTAEMLTQFLLLSGFVLLGDALKAEKRYSLQGALAGAAFGLAQLARYDTLLVILPLMALLLPAMVLPRYRRPVLSVLSTCVPLLIHVAIHQHYVAPFYRPLQSMVVPVLGAAGCAILLATIFNGTSLGERCRQWVGARGAGLRGLAVLAFVSWCIWAWGLRPAWSYAVATGGWLGRLPGQSLWDGLVGGREAFNMVYLQALFGPFGLALALIGLAGLIRRARGLNVWLWLLPSLIVMVIFVTRVFHDHFMMWVSRRFVPVVVPCLVVGLVAACAQLAAAVRHRRPRFAWMGVAMGLLALTLNGAASASMVRHRDWPGLSAWFERVAAALPADARLYCDQPGFAAPLRYLYGFNAYQVWARTEPGQRQLFRIVQRRARDESVYLLTMQSPVPIAAERLRRVAELPLQSVTQTQPQRRVPDTVRPRGGDFVLYQVIHPARKQASPPGTNMVHPEQNERATHP